MSSASSFGAFVGQEEQLKVGRSKEDKMKTQASLIRMHDSFLSDKPKRQRYAYSL